MVSKTEDLREEKTTKEPKDNSQSRFGALAWQAAPTLKALLVGFNLLRLNPSLRISRVRRNYRVWRDNVFPLYSSLLGARRQNGSEALKRRESAPGLCWTRRCWGTVRCGLRR